MGIDDSVTIDLLTLKRSNYLDELRDAVPAPRSTTPPDIGLPRWRRTPLDTRISAVPNIQRNVVLSRRKLGEPLRVNLSDKIEDETALAKPFDMSDPYNREISLPYDGLHDPHLARFFLDSPAVQETLIKAGLLTEELDVKCTLKEYNDYRAYIRKMHGKMMQRELEKRDDMQKEKLMLDVARKLTLKEVERLKKEEIRARLLNELKERREQKIQELFEKWKRSSQRLKSMSKIQRQRLLEKIAEEGVKREIFEEKRAAMAKREQQHELNALKRMHERDLLLAKTLQQNKIKKHNSKIDEALDRFGKKKKEQEEAIEKREVLKKCIEEIKSTFLDEYEKKLSRSRKKLQDIFVEKRKALEKSRTMKKKKLKKRSTCCCAV